MEPHRTAPNDPGRLLTAREVAQLLSVPTSWVYAQSPAGTLPTVHCGRYRRYRRAAVEAWLEHVEQPAS